MVVVNGCSLPGQITVDVTEGGGRQGPLTVMDSARGTQTNKITIQNGSMMALGIAITSIGRDRERLGLCVLWQTHFTEPWQRNFQTSQSAASCNGGVVRSTPGSMPRIDQKLSQDQ